MNAIRFQSDMGSFLCLTAGKALHWSSDVAIDRGHKMHRAVATVVCLLLFSTETGATSPICEDSNLSPPEWVQKHLESSDAVFLGRVISVTSPPGRNSVETESPAARSMGELLEMIEAGQKRDSESDVQIVSFEVLKAWKEPKLPVVRTKSRYVPGLLGFPFKVGDSFLIFARTYKGDFYRLELDCNETLHVSDATERIEMLNELSSAR